MSATSSFDIAKLDIETQLSQYKQADYDKLDLQIIQYNRKLRQEYMSGGGDFTCDRRFSYDLLSEFLSRNFGASYVSYQVEATSGVGCGKHLLRSLLQSIKQSSKPDFPNLENNIKKLIPMIIQYFKIQRSQIS